MQTEQGPPPPYGLPLPVDDYLIALLLIGIFYGAYKVGKIKLVSGDAEKN